MSLKDGYKSINDYNSLFYEIGKLKNKEETMEEHIKDFLKEIKEEFCNKAKYIIQIQDWTSDKKIYPHTRMSYQCTDNIKMIINDDEFSFNYINENDTLIKLMFLYNQDNRESSFNIKENECDLNTKHDFLKYIVDEYEKLTDIYYEELCDRFLMYDGKFANKDAFKKELAIRVLENSTDDINKAEIVNFLIYDDVVELIQTFNKVEGLDTYFDCEYIYTFALYNNGLEMENMTFELNENILETNVFGFSSNQEIISELNLFETKKDTFYEWLDDYIKVKDAYSTSEDKIQNYNFYYMREIKPLINQFDIIYKNRIKKMIDATKLLYKKDRICDFKFEQQDPNSTDSCKYIIDQYSFEIYFEDYRLNINKDNYSLDYLRESSCYEGNKLEKFCSLVINTFDELEKRFLRETSYIISYNEHSFDYNKKDDEDDTNNNVWDDGDDNLPF